MIKKFSVENFKGFKEKIELDFSNVSDYKYNKEAIKNNLIGSMVIYGKNASGKSNFGLALFDIVLHLTNKNKSLLQIANYLNADSNKSYATFDYEFIIDNKIVKYNYKKNQPKNSSDQTPKLIFEELVIDGVKVFDYDFNSQTGNFERLDLIEAQNLNMKNIDMGISVIRYIASNANLSQSSVLLELINFINGMLWYRAVTGNEYIGNKVGGEDIFKAIINSERVPDFERYLNDFGIPYKLSVVKDITGHDVLAVKFDENYIPFAQIASSGTMVLALQYYWSCQNAQISFLFIDEFDAHYHTELAEKVLIKIVKSRKMQSIFTTHNTALMSNRILRPDCYFIISNNKKLNSLPDCTEKELREAHNLEKMYRNNEFI